MAARTVQKERVVVPVVASAGTTTEGRRVLVRLLLSVGCQPPAPFTILSAPPSRSVYPSSRLVEPRIPSSSCRSLLLETSQPAPCFHWNGPPDPIDTHTGPQICPAHLPQSRTEPSCSRARARFLRSGTVHKSSRGQAAAFWGHRPVLGGLRAVCATTFRRPTTRASSTGGAGPRNGRSPRRRPRPSRSRSGHGRRRYRCRAPPSGRPRYHPRRGARVRGCAR